MNNIFDVVIIGGGPAGLTAALYASRAKMKTLVIEQKRKMGGQAVTTTEIENYPGFPATTGPVLMDIFTNHAKKFGTEFLKGKVNSITLNEDGFHKTINMKKGDPIVTKSIIISTGAEPRVLGIPGENTFRGAGVSYCATCDADFFEDLDIVVVGNGNTAVEESVYLSKFVNKITMVVIHDEGVMDADKTAQEHALENEKINFVWNSTVEEICGEDMVNKVVLKNVKTGELTDLDTDGVFMFVGTIPRTELVEDMVELNHQKYIKVNERMETSLPGIFACGDVIEKYLRQVITAAGDGAVAAVAAEKYIEEEESWNRKVTLADKPILVAFWSPLDAESISLITALEKDLERKNEFKLVKVDTSRNKRLAEKYQIIDDATILKIVKGKVINRLVLKNREDIKNIDNVS